MSGPHVAIEDLGALSAGTPDDPRWRHVESCPLCRARWLDFQSFVTGAPLPPEAGSGEAHRALEALIEREVAGTVVGRPRGRVWWGTPALSARPWMLAAAAVVIVGVVVLSRRPSAPPAGEVLRGPARVEPTPPAGKVLPGPAQVEHGPVSPEVLRGPAQVEHGPLSLEPVETAGVGELKLRWRAHPNADQYEVRLYREDMTEAGRIPAAAETTITFRGGQLTPPLPAGTTLLWRVVALRSGAEKGLSPVGQLKLP